jgi:hypothetical protein
VREHFTPRIRPALLRDDADPHLVRVAEEIFALGETHERNGDDRARRAAQWRRGSDALALLAAVLAATSGIVGLAWNTRIVAAVFALAAAVVAAVIATFQPTKRTARCNRSAAEHWRISGTARDLLNRLPEMPVDEARTALGHLRELAQRRPRERDGDDPG